MFNKSEIHRILENRGNESMEYNFEMMVELCDREANGKLEVSEVWYE